VSSGNKKASVPWGTLLGKEEEYVNLDYLPEGFAFKEPSKINKADSLAWLRFWFNRQEDPRTKTVFTFEQIRGNDGLPVKAIAQAETGGGRESRDGQKKSKPPVEKKGKAAKKKAGPVEPSAEDRSDDSSDSSQSEDEDEDEDDDGDGDSGEEQEQGPLRHLPFSAILKSYRTGAAGGASSVPKSRYRPAVGPQFKARQMRNRKWTEEVEVEADESPVKKKKKVVAMKKKAHPMAYQKTRRSPKRLSLGSRAMRR
jgi:hypothetical protein